MSAELSDEAIVQNQSPGVQESRVLYISSLTDFWLEELKQKDGDEEVEEETLSPYNCRDPAVTLGSHASCKQAPSNTQITQTTCVRIKNEEAQ